MAKPRTDLALVLSVGFSRLVLPILILAAHASLLPGQYAPPAAQTPGVQPLPSVSAPPYFEPQLPQNGLPSLTSPSLMQASPEDLYAPNLRPGQKLVVEVRVEGNTTIPVAKILPSIRTRAGRPFDGELVEEDVRRMNRTRLFVDVKPYTQNVPGGLAVIFKVVERPLLKEVKFVGASSIKPKTLAKEVGIKAGDALDPFAVEEGRAKIEKYYHEHGFSKVYVQVIEGDKPQDRRAIYLINEGRKQKVLWTRFVGNTIADDARLRTQIQSKPPFLYLFKGEVDRKKIDEDVERLTAYYRGLGFFRARVGRELEFIDDENWLLLTFVIDEGPRYQVRSISFRGNVKFNDGQLAENLKLKPGQFFNQASMLLDKSDIQDKYGGVGYIFADVKADPRFLEEPGKLDLVYEVVEGDRYRVGDINVQIKGDYPHTRIATVLNRLSLKPGDIVDIRELRASERRLRASGLFMVNPQSGEAPKIVFSPPSMEEGETEIARRPGPKYRGQSPDIPNPNAPPRDRRVNLSLQGRTLPPDQWPSDGEVDRAMSADPAPQPAPQGFPQSAIPGRPSFPTTQPFPSTQPLVVRGQYTTGRSTPSFTSRPTLPPGAVVPQQTVASPANQLADTAAYTPTYPPAAAPQPLAPVPAPAGGYGNAPAPTGNAAPYAPPPEYGPVIAPANPPANSVVAGPAVPTPLPPGGGIMSEGSPFFGGRPEGETTRPLPLTVETSETQTGRFMFGVGVNSDAGLVGSIMLDEQNFDLFRPPRSWQDIVNATAWRGAGQRLRIEAVPGTEVQRYMVNFQEPYLLDSNVALGLSGFFYDRRYLEWDEQRVGGRVSLGYQFTHDLSGSVAFRGAKVNISNPIDPTIPELADALGNNSLYGFALQLAHDTRDNAFLATEGHLIEFTFEQVIGTFLYPRAEFDIRRYFLLHERPDGSGRHVLSLSFGAAITGNDTPIYDHYFIGGFSTLRGFDFREASPRDRGVLVGGEFMMLAKIQYLFPITADDMLRAVVFCDTGTVEPTIDNWTDNYRVAPGVGLRITVPAMGPAPIALDFAFPVAFQSGDRLETFSFFVGFNY